MTHWSYVYLASEWAIRLAMLIYVPQRRTAAASRTWLLLMFLLPWPGLLLYGLFGRIYVPKRRIEEQERASRHIRAVQAQMSRCATLPSNLSPHLAPIAALAAQLGDFEPFGGNRVELLPEYHGTIDRLVADIEASRSHAHLLFYIFDDDDTGRRMAAALNIVQRRPRKRGRLILT